MRIAAGDADYADRSLISDSCRPPKRPAASALGNASDGASTVDSIRISTADGAVPPGESSSHCNFLFQPLVASGMSDSLIGLILLVCSLVLLFSCLCVLVKVLHSMLRGQLAKTIERYVNDDLPGGRCCGYMTGYVAIVVGAVMTLLLQSSSVFTSTLTPLVGMGVVRIERMYPLTLGSNVGTTGTG